MQGINLNNIQQKNVTDSKTVVRDGVEKALALLASITVQVRMTFRFETLANSVKNECQTLLKELGNPTKKADEKANYADSIKKPFGLLLSQDDSAEDDSVLSISVLYEKS